MSLIRPITYTFAPPAEKPMDDNLYSLYNRTIFFKFHEFCLLNENIYLHELILWHLRLGFGYYTSAWISATLRPELVLRFS